MLCSAAALGSTGANKAPNLKRATAPLTVMLPTLSHAAAAATHAVLGPLSGLQDMSQALHSPQPPQRLMQLLLFLSE